MAATPRKFQEKIALINERAAQGTAAYEEIMQQVSSLRNKPRIISQEKSVSSHQQTQTIPSRSAHSGSLPDFSINLSQNNTSGYCYQYPQQGAVSDLINLTQMYSASGGTTGNESIFGANRQHVSLQNTAVHPAVVAHRHSHLQPPDLLARSSSDSSLHQTAFQNKIVGGYRKGFVSDDKDRPHLGSINYEIHKTSTESFQPTNTMYNHVGRSPTITIPTTSCNPCSGPGAGPGGGSLPDLTQVQFMPTPVPIPDLDSLVANQTGFSGMPSSMPCGPFPRANGPYMVRSPPSRGTSPGPSPRPSPNVDRKQKNKPYSQPLAISGQRISSANKTCLSVPSNLKAHLHMSKGIVTNNSIVEAQMPNSPGLNMFGRPVSPVGSHPTSPIAVPLMDYRNPVGSPQSSPCASPIPNLIAPQTGPMTQYRCNSPDSRGSAPPSPVSLQHSSSPASSPGATLAKPFIYDTFAQTQTTNQLNHQFQQITVMERSPRALKSRYPHKISGHLPKQSSPLADQLEASLESSGSPYYSGSPSNVSSPPSFSLPSTHQSNNTFSGSPTSPIFTQSCAHIPSSHPSSPSHSPGSSRGGAATPLSQQPATPQTPQTPNVPLPRLVVTDQDGNDEQNLLNEVPEISFFDDAIFQNLSTLGEEEMMSVEQILVDTEIEESFRRDLRNAGQDILQLGGDFQEHYMQQQQVPTSFPQPHCPDALNSLPQFQLSQPPSQGHDQQLPESLHANFVTCPDGHGLTQLESLTRCMASSSAAEAEALLSQIHQQMNPDSPLEPTGDISGELELGIHSVNNPSTVGWQQISQPNPQS